jgi:hypothetical protein
MQRDNLEWLEEWYRDQCDGDWENSRGMRLEPLRAETAEPHGWRLTIDLAGTSAVNALPKELRLDSRGGEWIACSIGGNRFEGSGDPRKLEKIIGVFRQWVEAAG